MFAMGLIVGVTATGAVAFVLGALLRLRFTEKVESERMKYRTAGSILNDHR